MKISWLGHSCFKIKCKEIDLVIDPYSDSIGIKMPKVKADAVLVTHNHDDHNNISAITGNPLIINGPGEYEMKGTFIYGKRAYHDNKNGLERGAITIYLIEEAGITVAHLGDFNQDDLVDEQMEFLKNVDVLLVPVGGTYSLNSDGAIKIINEIEPRVIIPMHYKCPGVKISLDGVDKFINEIGLSPEKLDEFKISKESLPQNDMKLVILNKQ
ncbi:MAG TPA: MBL fold metallo-hydrolase [bacterium]|jgi:L-ascorbate metabolism protein UlaG (beta-lactamase superfamily)|nr:MBL fold metallo-hydrolase [bacterium]HOG38422.1 MBL fold metallo-hydrolase [bacterium]HQI03317.1 MBL fold metallo-hydrolase [bacterium]